MWLVSSVSYVLDDHILYMFILCEYLIQRIKIAKFCCQLWMKFEQVQTALARFIGDANDNFAPQKHSQGIFIWFFWF